MTTVLVLAGADGMPQQVDVMLGGSVIAGNTVNNLTYFNSWIDNSCITNSSGTGGAQVLDKALRSTTGQVTVLAHSLGAVCCCYWLANYASNASSYASPANVRFILLGNSVRPYGGWCYYNKWFTGVTVPTNTPYTVTDFARQYDGWADFCPGKPGAAASLTTANYQGVQNAYAGQGAVHPNYISSRLNNPANVSYQVGNITYVWEPTFPVPSIGSINLSGQIVNTWGWQTTNQSFKAQDKQLRPLIEKAYSRPVVIPPPDYTKV